MAIEEYNPLDYENLTRNCVQELMTRGPFKLPLEEQFSGAGVYALFYKGKFPPYKTIRSEDGSHPIYVGKAVLPGARKGATEGAKAQGKSLFNRITQHTRSIQSANNLKIEDFVCRFLVVTPLWITMAERFLIEHYHPIWNVCIEGFGNHDPGKGRHQGENTWWDALHPGREWAMKLQQTKTPEMAVKRLEDLLAGRIEPDLNAEEEEQAA